MSLKILASLIILIAVVAHATKRQQRIAENREKEFWARERKANSVRKKPLDDLDYVKIPITIAPIAQAIVYQPADKPTLKACSETPIVEAPPTARPMIVTAISGADNLRPASA